MPAGCMDATRPEPARAPSAGLRIDGRPEALAHWRAALLALPGQPAARTLWIASIDLSDWPLAETVVLEALGQWLRQPGRSLTLLLREPEAAARLQTRFARWRRDYSHAIHCLGPTPALSSAQSSALWEAWPQGLATEAGCSERLPGLPWRLRVQLRPTVPQALWRPWLQECESCWPAHTLGL
ncbi:MAG: hypothetical protein RLY78_3703 [Pseudomonadota bacterium]